MQWAKPDSLLIRVAVTARTGRDSSSARSMISAAGQEITSRRIVSINPATGGAVVLFENQRQRLRATRNLGVVVDLLYDDPDHVLMAAPTAIGVMALHNVATGAAEQVERGSNNTYGFATANGVPVLRYDINMTGSAISIFARAPGDRDWKFVRRLRVEEAPDFAYIGETGQAGSILVASREAGEDVMSVRELDLTSLKVGPPKVSRSGADVVGGVLDRRENYLGAAYFRDRLEYDFATPELAPHHRAMNRFFSDECNVAFSGIDETKNRILTYVSGPREPGAWYLYDRAARNYVNLAPRTSLLADRLGGTEALTVRTRDGAEIRAYLTAPPGAAPGPLVVLPHGGPEVRDVMDWDRQVQILASQGWWVLQPNFRGSGGYGLGFASLGWKRWGDRMQEDVEDAVDQVVAAKGLDRNRIAIMGASYGGYAALMGAVRRPDLYKAAISICGLGDLPDMLGWERRNDDTPNDEVYGFWTKRIGDPAVDAATIERASPRRRVSEIKCPVFLVHGADDPVVPVYQSRQMNAALRGAGKTVDYVEVQNAGHGDWEDDVEQDLMGRYIALLNRVFA
jgi:pimeloyl-ACP methyl ester carboxylesterase